METMERDPAFIAEQVKFIRKLHRLTQQNLADAAGLTTRTIEKIESGRHRPDEQTLRSIARAMQIDAKYFEKPTPEQEARQKAEMERALRKMVLVPTHPIHTTSDFLGAFEQRHAFRIDTSAVTADEALDAAAAMTDYITDLNDIWDDVPRSQQLEYARSFVELCRQIEEHGYVCYMGDHRQRLREKDRPTLVFGVGLMTIQPKEGVDGTRYALIHLEGRWESLDADRVLRPLDPA
ncbi:Helix-turn-helix domain protein [Mesorhizobium prunaredense]|uniref:Helix-turn-helix domain protein n=1 Tax=Mesorhizobium prunaredense TaxID=1631249 RepID=A0A1R3VD78_9HYPH|nr:helix-turn-helix transcriptional regulator [Mesorhizobium prunaredense]SIT57204.1 Helix-turn-helix domain protein [Mesorhizobium prunaredense]